jgi:hypothetical protein
MSSGSTRRRNAIVAVTIYACVWGYFVAHYFVERDDSLIILGILGLPMNMVWFVGTLMLRHAPAAGVQAALMLIFGGIQYGIVGWISGRPVAKKQG